MAMSMRRQRAPVAMAADSLAMNASRLRRVEIVVGLVDDDFGSAARCWNKRSRRMPPCGSGRWRP
jgi:hypothetical protein